MLIVVNVRLGWTRDPLAKAVVPPIINMHKSISLTVPGLALLRLLWRFGQLPPACPVTYQRWDQLLSRLVHGLLYVVMLGLPLTGCIMDSVHPAGQYHPVFWFGLFEFPHLGAVMHLAPAMRDRVHEFFEAAHGLSADALYALLFLHAAGALKHRFIDRETEVQRISWGRCRLRSAQEKIARHPVKKRPPFAKNGGLSG